MKSVFLLLICVGCTDLPHVVRPDPDPPSSGTPCERACQRLEDLRCPEANPEAGEDGTPGTQDDIDCRTWMCNADYLDYESIANAQTCEEAVDS